MHHSPKMPTLATHLARFLIWQAFEVLDPSELQADNLTITPDWRDVSLPLKGVCEAQARAGVGAFIFVLITAISLGGVIFSARRDRH